MSFERILPMLEAEATADSGLSLAVQCAASQAISLKRIADFLTVGNAFVGDVHEGTRQAHELARDVGAAFSADEEAGARHRCAAHYAERFQKARDDAHVLMNVDANWRDYL